MLWEASKVSGEGYYLYYKDAAGALPEELFKEGNLANLELLIQVSRTGTSARPLETTLTSYHNCIKISGLTSSQKDEILDDGAFLEETEALVPVLQTPPGHIGFKYTRNNDSRYRTAELKKAAKLLKAPDSDADELTDLAKDEVLPLAGQHIDDDGKAWVYLLKADQLGWVAAADVNLNLGTASDEFKNMYQLLGYCVTDSDGFNASEEALPIGPQIEGKNKSRWVYDRQVPAYMFAKGSALPGLPSVDPNSSDPFFANPYSGIGKTGSDIHSLNLWFFWQDLFGNRIRLDESSMKVAPPVHYFDPIIGINQWPGVAERYYFETDAGIAKIVLEFAFETKNFEPTPGLRKETVLKNIDAALARYKQVIYQLSDPHLSLEAQSFVSLSDTADKNKFIDFVTEIYEYLLNLKGFTEETTTIVSGETLTDVCERLSSQIQLSPLELALGNEPTENLFAAGTKLRIPFAHQVSGPDISRINANGNLANIEANVPLPGLKRVIRAGDTLESLATTTGKTVEEFIEDHKTRTDLLLEGLTLPLGFDSTLGDTLETTLTSLSTELKQDDEEDILTDAELRVEAIRLIQDVPGLFNLGVELTLDYVTQTGDSMASISAATNARSFTSFVQILQDNLSSGTSENLNAIAQGDFLNFEEEYEVKAGDSLGSIVKGFQDRYPNAEHEVTSIQDIIALNASVELRDGQSILVPGLFTLPTGTTEPDLLVEKLAVSSAAPSEAIFPVFAEVLLSRPEELVDATWADPAKGGLKDIQQVSAFLSPKSSDQLTGTQSSDESASLLSFAEQFQATFEDFYLALSHERPRQSTEIAAAAANGERLESNQLGKKFLWGVHIDTLSTQDASVKPIIQYNVQESGPNLGPVFFAPVPMSRILLSGSVEIPDYDIARGISSIKKEKEFVNVDINPLAREFLLAIEEFLDPTQVLELLGSNAADSVLQSNIKSIIRNKHLLADAISSQIDYVLKDDMTGLPRPNDPAWQAAKESFKEQLLVNLVKGFDQETIIQYKVLLGKAGFTSKEPRLCGTPSMVDVLKDGVSIKDSDALDFSLSPAKVSIKNDASFLTFLFNTQSPRIYEKIKLDMVYGIQSLEREIIDLDDFHDAEDSSWLTFLLPEDLDNYRITTENLERLKKTEVFSNISDPDKTNLTNKLESLKDGRVFKTRAELVEEIGISTLSEQAVQEVLAFARLTPENPNYLGLVEIPIPLRSYPVSPNIIQHRAEEDPDSEKTLKEILNWEYNFTYEQPDVAQDTVLASINYNVAPPSADADQGVSIDQGANHKMFAPLLKFSELYLDLQKDLQKIKDKGLAEQKRIVQNFASLVSEVTTAWKAWSASPSAGSILPHGEFFIIDENEEVVTDGVFPDRKMEIKVRNFDPRSNTLTEKEVRADNYPKVDLTGFKLESIHLPGEDENLIPIIQDVALTPPSSKELAYELKALTQDQLSRETNLGDSRFLDRTLRIPNRKILRQQNAWASMRLIRNFELVEDERTNPAFIFRTPDVRFKTKVTPFLVNNERWDLALEATGVRLADPVKRTLKGHLETLFATILPEVTPHNYDIRLGCQYGFTIAEGNAFTVDLLTRLPVALGMRFPLKAGDRRDSDKVNTLLNNLVKEVDTWKKKHCPDETEGMYIFSLSLFSHLDDDFANLPLLKIEHLGVRLLDIS